MTLLQARQALRSAASPAKAKVLASFFKTGPGQYGHGDQFIGVTVPETRRVARQLRDTPLKTIESLLRSPIHEERLLALLAMVDRFDRDPDSRREVYDLYMARRACINNWDLVDLSAPNIVGAFLEGRDRSILPRLATAPSVWDRRIAILATFHDIRRGRPQLALDIATILVGDSHDLIHKAVGWMLREMGKRTPDALTRFLDRFAPSMPRTMLRYAIERLPEARRKHYMTLPREPQKGNLSRQAAKPQRV